MAFWRRLVDPFAAVVVVGAIGVVPVADAWWAERSVRRPCGEQEGPRLSAAVRAEVTRAATTAITVLGSTGRRGEYDRVATAEMLRDVDGARSASWHLRGGSETVTGVSAVGITRRCAESGPGEPAGTLSLMALGRARTAGARPVGARDAGARDGGARDGGARDGGARDGGARDGGAPAAGARDGGARGAGARDAPARPVERVRRWFLTMVPTPQGWRAARMFQAEGPDDESQEIVFRVRSEKEASSWREVLLTRVNAALAEVFTYRLKDPAATSHAVDRHLTGEAVAQHRAIFDPVVTRARQAGGDVETENAGAGILRVSRTSATLMAFLDREAVWYSGERFKRPAVPSDRRETTLGPPGNGSLAYIVTAVYESDGWRIARIHSLT